MTKNRDVVAVIEKLRPVTVVQDQWPASTRQAALERLLSSADEVQREPFQSLRRRRVVLTAALSVGLVASGTGIAAAAGVLPDAFTKPLSFWTVETGGAVDVQSAQRVAQAPGPDGKVLSVWSAKSKDGTTCIAPLFEAPGELGRPAPTNFKLAGGQCTPANQRTESFGDGGGSENGRGIHTMWYSAGQAVRADLRLSDGTVRPALHAEGLFFVWYFASENVDPPTLIGYDAGGRIIGEQSMPNLNTSGPPHPGN